MNTHYEYITTVGSLTGVVRYITNGVLWGISCHRHRYIIYDDSICRHIKPYVDVCIWANAAYYFAWTTLRADEHFVFEFDALTRHHGRTHGYISRRLQIFPTSCSEKTIRSLSSTLLHLYAFDVHNMDMLDRIVWKNFILMFFMPVFTKIVIEISYM